MIVRLFYVIRIILVTNLLVLRFNVYHLRFTASACIKRLLFSSKSLDLSCLRLDAARLRDTRT